MRVGRHEAEHDLYRVLGVEPGAPPETIRRAHKRLARLHHPDLSGDHPEARARAERRMKRINHAAALLLDPQARSTYDALRSGRHRPAPRAAAPRSAPPAWYEAPPSPPSAEAHAAPWRPSPLDALLQLATAPRGPRSAPPLLGLALFATVLLASLAPHLGGPTPVSSPAYKIRKAPERVTMWADAR